MQTIEVERFRTLYRLPVSAEPQRRRLDKVADLLLSKAFERAVDELGFSAGEEVCIEEIATLVRVDLSRTDEALASEWSRALADAIRKATTGGVQEKTIRVARYRSRHLALFEMAAGVASGDLNRVWAWKQLDLWRGIGRPSPPEAVRELVRVLVREPRLIVPVLVALAQRGLLERLMSRFESTYWVALATAALNAAGATVDWRDLRPPAGDAEDDPAEPETWPLPERFLRTSRLAPWLADPHLAPEAGPAVAALILLETEPARAVLPRERLLAFLRALPGVVARRRSLQPGSSAEPVRHRLDDSETGGPVSTSPAEEPTIEGERRQALTRYGGLLFLLRLLDALSIPSRLLSEFNQRPFRWVLLQLANTLLSVSPDDPAALAFAGLSPSAPPPYEDDDPASPEECQRLSAIVTVIETELNTRLQPLQLQGRELIEFVCARRAAIVADPGWIEARFSLSDVSTDLRRTGLDLDPGYVPWLGVVVKFVYE